MSFLIVENLSKAYTDKPLFKDINFTLEPQDKIALIDAIGKDIRDAREFFERR